MIVSSAPASCVSAQAYLILISSACCVGVRSAIAMSLVTWSPAIGMFAVWRIAPSVKIAMSVVPPPMSTMQTPSSFSSSESTAYAEASCSRIRSRTSRPQRRTHFSMFWAAFTAPVTRCTFASRRTPGHAQRLLHALLAVDQELLRQDVQDLLIRGNRDGLGSVDDAVHVEYSSPRRRGSRRCRANSGSGCGSRRSPHRRSRSGSPP